MTVRRVVMSETEPGRSEFTHVEEVQPRTGFPGQAYDVWGWDAAPTLPISDSAPYGGHSVIPSGAGGVRVIVMGGPSVEPAGDPAPPSDVTEIDPGLQAHDSAIPGMHSTDTVDVVFVLSGHIASVTTEGVREVLGPGDVYVQNGAPHAWMPVEGAEPAKLGIVMLGLPRSTA